METKPSQLELFALSNLNLEAIIYKKKKRKRRYTIGAAEGALDSNLIAYLS